MDRTSIPPSSSSAFEVAEHREGRFAGSGAISLYYQAWLPREGATRAVLVNLHGLGDHSGLYPNLATYFPRHAIALYAYDMRGNGRSPGQRAYVRDWGEFLADLDAFLELVQTREGPKPLFVLGNSLGGLVVLEYALRHPRGLSGVIAAAPPLGRLGVPPLLMALGRGLSRLLPRFSIRTGMDLSGLARDPAVVQTVLADPLFHRWGTARLSTEVTAAINRVQERAGDLSVPVLILHGTEDRMVPPDGSRSFMAKVRHRDRELREYAGAYHALFADVNHQEVLRDVEQWIDKHIPPGQG